MTVTLVLIVLAGLLVACGVTLLLERTLTRILVGLVLMSNGANLMFLVASGQPGRAPIVGGAGDRAISDPLPQAMVLTAIVITLGVTAFLLAMAYRSWQLNRHDEVRDDVEDALVRRLAALDEASASYDESTGGELDEEGTDP